MSTNVSSDTTQTVEEKLVELALKGPSSEVSERQRNMARLQVKAAKNSWFNLLTISTNYNDQSFAKKVNNQNNTYVYPKYFFGINIPLGLFFTKGSEIKSAKEALKISSENVEINRRNIKSEVLGKYLQYKATTELLVLQDGLISEVLALYLQMEKKFSENTASIDAYNTASKRYNDELSKRINLNLERDLIKLDLEKMIGVSLDAVLNPVNAAKKNK